ncbi:MAG: LruC domain-containing protein [Bacteroidales bacterium]|nr:LruC domain-containing protein [Bacteroidales bacterium]
MFKLKNVVLTGAMFLFIAAGTSCVKNNSGSSTPDDPNTQTYATSQTVTATISYSSNAGETLFYVYDQNPIKNNGSNVGSLDTTIPALDAAFTDENGIYSGKLHLPAYASTVYIVANTPGVVRVLKGTVSNGTLTVSDADATNAVASLASSTKAPSKATKYGTDMSRFAKLGWHDDLGTYDATTGIASYTNDPSISLVSTTTQKKLKKIANSVFSINSKLSNIYRTQEDLLTGEDNTELTLMVIMGQTCWNNPVGYYYYEDGKQPASIKDCRVYTIFPNSQVEWSLSGYEAYPKALKIGDKVQLKYFGLDGTSAPTTKFPKGLRIGFVLANNMWNLYFNGFADYYDTHSQKVFYACSTPATAGTGWSTTLTTHTAYFRDESYPNDIIMGFEDRNDDENFEDVVFALTSNPAITNVPTVNGSGTIATMSRYGFYAFEDLWPKTGDFDMNDVMSEYVYTKTFNYSDKITKEQFSFTLYPNSKTTLKNGIGFMFNTVPSGATISVTKDGAAVTANTEESGKVVLLTDDVASSIGSAASTTYVVTVNYGSGSTKTVSDESSINAFIYRASANDASKRWELHTPMNAPTSLMDYSYFGTQQDCSVPGSGIYYVLNSGGYYPFAFYLENATTTDMAKLLDVSYSETKQISLLFPYFSAWAKDNSVHKDWYKTTSSN